MGNESDRPGSPRILVLRGGAIGDFLMTLPAVAALRRRWPAGYIECIGYPHIATLALAGRLIDRVTSLDKAEAARLFAAGGDLPPSQRAYLRSFDLVVSYLYDPDEIVRANMARAGVRHYVYGSPIVREGHAVAHLMKPLEQLAIYPEGDELPRLALPEEAIARGRGRLDARGKPVAALHAGSGSPKKNWPTGQFLELAERVAAEAEMTPAFVIGESDDAVARELAARSVPWPVLSGCALVETAEALAACAAYVGNDSGITHLAAALGLPVVAIFGPSDPALWAPRGPRVRVVASAERTSDSLRSVPVDEVFAALRACIQS